MDSETQAYLRNKDYYLDRDTLIVKNKKDNESATAHDFNFKAFIESDSIVSVKIYLPNLLSDRTKKKMRKIANNIVTNPIVIKHYQYFANYKERNLRLVLEENDKKRITTRAKKSCWLSTSWLAPGVA